MMVTMGSSSLKNDSLYDPIRKKRVDKGKEEIIRQQLVRHMVEKLGYPRSLITIEKELSQLPHLRLTPPQNIPKRRADIIAFAKTKSTLSPLIMIECKATPLTPKFAQQVIGYNTFVGAPFLALANARQILTGCFDPSAGIYRFEQGLPPFATLLAFLIDCL
jgi:hypothetical protein